MTKITSHQEGHAASIEGETLSDATLPAYQDDSQLPNINDKLTSPEQEQPDHHHSRSGRRHRPHHHNHDHDHDPEIEAPPSPPPFYRPMPHHGPRPGPFPPHAGPSPHMHAPEYPEMPQWGRRWHPFQGHHGRGRGGGRGGFGRGGAHRGRRGHGGMGRGGWFGGPWIRPFVEGLDALRQLDDDVNGEPDGFDFTPAVDSFESDHQYELHVELPGAKKSDLGVHWDEEARHLRLSGVVHRPGDEEFLKTLSSEERQIGVFQRDVQFEKAIESSNISAKLEDGLLVVLVPKAKEKERRVEVQTVPVN